ncbi:MAG: cache domain-containing protein [Bacteroidales bacterium]|nr:MAG: cache domain-containing protein [Bacteroidales bacterium]
MTTRNKITFGLILIILITFITLAVVINSYVDRVFIKEVQNRVRNNLNSAHDIYNDYTKRVNQIIKAISIRRAIDSPLDNEIKEDLGKVFSDVYEESGIDILTLVDLDGNVIFRAHNPESKGDNLAELPIIKKVMDNWESYNGTIILNKSIFEKDGVELTNRAAIHIIKTPNARTYSGVEEARGMFIASAVPFTSLYNDQIIGILLGGYLLNNNIEIVDKIKNTLFQGQEYDGKDIGTATIFFNDLRISTNVLDENNRRAIGSCLSEEVYNHVIKSGEIWADRAFVVNDWYITAYEPIYDLDKNIIGSLYVGLLEEPYKRPQKIITLFILIILSVTAISSALLAVFYIKKIIKPIDKIILACKKIMSGDISARADINPPGEMGLLCKTIDNMAASVEEYEKKLQKETQMQISQSEKLASIGRLASGVAHEINNPLTSILNFAHLLRNKKEQNEEDKNDINIIIQETNRVRKIVSGLLDFARQSQIKKEWLDIQKVIQQLVLIIKKQKDFGKITIIENYTKDLKTIFVDKNQMQQVFLNLLLNAAEAIGEQGKITITSSVINEKLTISIQDTGCGIKSEDIHKVFDPFYTNKRVGKGTGLGLSVSYGIIQQYGGNIEVESKVGKGSTFRVILPLNEKDSISELNS